MNERIKLLRKKLNINQDKFSSKINISRSHFAAIENGSKNITERVLADICREFNVNEKWIKDGIEPIFKEENDDSLEEYLNKKGCTDLEKKAVKKFMDVYMNIPEEQRDEFFESFMKTVKIAFNVPHNSFDNFNKNKD